MIEIIQNIFKEENFEIINYDTKDVDYESFFAKRVTGEKFDFFLVVQVSEQNLDLENIDLIIKKYLEIILKNEKYPGVDKNLSMILLTERNTIEITDEFNKKVYEFEENPYHFKKFLLPFTKSQKLYLEDCLKTYMLQRIFSNQKHLIAQLNRIINDKNMFYLFKNSGKEPKEKEVEIFDLVSKIFIKLPFLQVQISKDTLPNLTKQIEDEIPNDNKQIIENLLSIESDDPEWDEILSVLGVNLNEV